MQTIRVRAVEGRVVFALNPATGRVAMPLRAVGREGPSAQSPATEHEDVADFPLIRRSIESGDLELVNPEENG